MALWNKRIDYPKRLFLWLFGYSILLVGCFVAFQYHREKEFKADELNSQLQLVNTYILNELNEGHGIKEMRLKELHPFDDLRVSIIGNDGRLIYDNASDSISDTNHSDRAEIAAARLSGTGYSVRRHSQSTGEYYFYSAKMGDNNVIVRTAVPYSLSLSQLLKADYGFIWVMGAITLVMCVLGFFATRRIGLYILRLNRFAKIAESGERIIDIEPFPHDELGEISNHIVRLYARLQRALSERDREHSAALHQQKEKERIKKQLTNNINHELKTPIASIQICLETLKAYPDMKEGKRMEFIDRCLANSERLSQLLADVSMITRMDEGGKAIEMEALCLTDIITDVVEDISPVAYSKGFRISTSLPPDIYVNGNRTLLESVFRNLIDNAIAYSGGDKISIHMHRSVGEKIKITVDDNGKGVGEEHLPRLFERFYRVDKGRSRTMGGTGLGLSIVKNAILMHHGTIMVTNLIHGGLRFEITLNESFR